MWSTSVAAGVLGLCLFLPSSARGSGWGECTEPTMSYGGGELNVYFSGNCSQTCGNCPGGCLSMAVVMPPSGAGGYCGSGVVQGSSASCEWDAAMCPTSDASREVTGYTQCCCAIGGVCYGWTTICNRYNKIEIKGDPVGYSYETHTPSVLTPGQRKSTYNDFDPANTQGDSASANLNPTTILYRTLEDGRTVDPAGSVLPYHYVTRFTYSTTCPPPGIVGVGEKITGVTDPRGYTTRFGYTTVWTGSTVACNLTATETALGQRTEYGDYTSAGDPQQITDPNGLVTQLLYNAARQVTTLLQVGAGPGGTDLLTTFEYTAGDLTAIQLPKGNWIVYTWDTAGTPHSLTAIARRATRTGPDLEKIAYLYDSAGNRTREEVRDASGTLRRFTEFAYDTRNRLFRVFNPTNASQFIQYGYEDGFNQRTSITDELGRTTSFTYTTVVPPGMVKPTPFLRQVQDPLSGVTQYLPDVQGNLTTVTDATTASTQYQFDDLGRLVTATAQDTG